MRVRYLWCYRCNLYTNISVIAKQWDMGNCPRCKQEQCWWNDDLDEGNLVAVDEVEL